MVGVGLTRCSLRCVQLISGVLGRAGEAGKMKRIRRAQRGAAKHV